MTRLLYVPSCVTTIAHTGCWRRPVIAVCRSASKPFLDHTDLHDNRVSLYAHTLPPGTYHYSYLAQATVAGSYEVAPSHASESFFPEVFGRSAGVSFVVR